MKYDMSYDEKNKVLRAEVYEKFDAQTGVAFFKDFKSYSDEQQRYLLANIYEPAQKLVDKETRRTMRENAKGLKWEKIAIIGAKASLRMVVKIVLTAAGKGKETQFFDAEEDALAWLKSEQEKAKEQASA